MNQPIKIVESMDWSSLKHEYGLDGKRLLPWSGVTLPFGGAYCVVREGTVSLPHVNEPADEEEMFICIDGTAEVVIGERRHSAKRGDVIYIPAGEPHHVDACLGADFHFYTLWWSKGTCGNYIDERAHADV
jgi:oxalate decarboxylase/phosphoglucose isomerase-like protein (cupin superfamily)|tara:strand:+ start:45493 stop:45885 length:393 start_codon:yes stop_codon:yes gene_type:complete